MTPAQHMLLLAPSDNVWVAIADLPAGQRLQDDGREIVLPESVPLGHKLSRQPIGAGDKIIKYGACIASATRDIPAGAWVHLHNLASDYLATPAAGHTTRGDGFARMAAKASATLLSSPILWNAPTMLRAP